MTDEIKYNDKYEDKSAPFNKQLTLQLRKLTSMRIIDN